MAGDLKRDSRFILNTSVEQRVLDALVDIPFLESLNSGVKPLYSRLKLDVIGHLRSVDSSFPMVVKDKDITNGQALTYYVNVHDRMKSVPVKEQSGDGIMSSSSYLLFNALEDYLFVKNCIVPAPSMRPVDVMIDDFRERLEKVHLSVGMLELSILGRVLSNVSERVVDPPKDLSFDDVLHEEYLVFLSGTDRLSGTILKNVRLWAKISDSAPLSNETALNFFRACNSQTGHPPSLGAKSFGSRAYNILGLYLKNCGFLDE